MISRGPLGNARNAHAELVRARKLRPKVRGGSRGNFQRRCSRASIADACGTQESGQSRHPARSRSNASGSCKPSRRRPRRAWILGRDALHGSPRVVCRSEDDSGAVSGRTWPAQYDRQGISGAGQGRDRHGRAIGEREGDEAAHSRGNTDSPGSGRSRVPTGRCSLQMRANVWMGRAAIAKSNRPAQMGDFWAGETAAPNNGDNRIRDSKTIRRIGGGEIT
jgi:hypothetical protein